jgi:hypothetical protein
VIMFSGKELFAVAAMILILFVLVRTLRKR